MRHVRFARIRGARPSPAFVVSVIALTFAIGGGSFAVAAGLPGTADKKSDKKIAAAQDKALVPGIVKHLAARLSVNHARSADNASTAGHASTADTASTAASAATAGGLTPIKIYAALPPNTATTNILNSHGFTITMACDASGNVTLKLNTPSDPGGTQATSQGNNDSTGVFTREDEHNASGSTVDLTGNPGVTTDGGSQFGGSVASGTSISGMIQFKPSGETYLAPMCVADGHAFIG